jgi:hypothetical protein
MPSASSFGLHAVTDINGNATAFFRSPTNNALNELSNGKLTAIAASGTVTDFSAGLDANGHADLFAHHNGRIQEFDGGVWSDLGQPMTMQSFAAVDGGRAYFVGGDNSLWEYTPVYRVPVYYRGLNGQLYVGGYRIYGGWQELWGANAVWALDAVTERPQGVNSGRDVVFAVGGDGRLEAYTQGGWFGTSNQWLTLVGGSSDGTRAYNSFSAGLDAQGISEVYYVSTSGTLFRRDMATASVVTGLLIVKDGVDPFSTIRATTNGRVILSDQVTSEYTDQGFEYFSPIFYFPGGINDLAAANPSTCFAIGSDGHHLYEWTGSQTYVTFQI